MSPSGSQLIKNIREVSLAARDILGGRYPEFVYNKDLKQGQLPVFTFHTVDGATFDEDLLFLKENGYHPLSLSEFCAVIREERAPTEREILLTFDDGFYHQMVGVLPYLEKHEVRATVFLIPGRIQEDVELENSKSDNAYISWDFARELANHPLIDIGSHSLTHSLIFTTPEIVDFVSPRMLRTYPFYEIPGIRDGNGYLSPWSVPLGTPIFRALPRLGSALRYCDDVDLRQKVVEYVDQHGKETFFNAKNWKKDLNRLVKEHRARHGSIDHYESEEERVVEFRNEIIDSKTVLESHLEGCEITAFCYPWHEYCDLSVELCREAGYRVSFVGKGEGGFQASVGDDPQKIARIGQDFLRLLPGNGRLSLQDILMRKVKNRLRKGSPFLAH